MNQVYRGDAVKRVLCCIIGYPERALSLARTLNKPTPFLLAPMRASTWRSSSAFALLLNGANSLLSRKGGNRNIEALTKHLSPGDLVESGRTATSKAGKIVTLT